MPKIVTIHRYAGLVREMANRIKNPADDHALRAVAEEMAQVVPEGAVLVPAPSSSGRNRAMTVLAEYISLLVPESIVVEAVVRIFPMPSKVLLRRAGKALPTLEKQIESMTLAKPIPPSRQVWIVDNVVTRGDTIRAMEAVIGQEVNAVVYADAGRVTRTSDNPPTGRVCVSGSRTYVNLQNVDEILRILPKDIVILHGGATGVDRRAGLVASELGLAVEVCLAEWNRYGRRAGPIRNRAMVASCDFLYAFWDGVSRGTASAIQAAVDEDIPFEIVEDIP